MNYAPAAAEQSPARADAAREPSGASSSISAFGAYARRVRPGLDAALVAYLDRVTASVEGLPADVRAVVDAMRDLTLRGGKRLRAVLMAAAYEACGGSGGPDAVVLAGVSLELLQSYLLIHDDWMDADDTRRGGPSVPAMVKAHLAGRARGPGDRTADSYTILAGDFAAGVSLEALAAVPLPAQRVAGAMGEMARMQRDVVLGQLCDVHGSSSSELPTEAEVELIHTLKTASYTVRGPLLLGARLAGADEETCRALDAFSRPIGVAFQLRDDLLGTFGDPARTGKPSGGDIREGKRTGLIAALVAARPDARTASLLSRAFGRADADAADVDAILESMVAAEAPRKVEARIHALLAEATRTLDLAPIPDDSRALLRGAALTLAHREA